MTRVKTVIITDPPPPPGQYATKEGALAAKPYLAVVIGSTSTERKASNAAAALNLDCNPEWDAAEYYATWCPNPDAEEAKEAWFVLVGRRENLPDVLRKRVENPQPKGHRGDNWTGPRLSRVDEVILMDPKKTVLDDDDASDKRLKLAAAPKQCIVDSVHATEKAVELAASRVNSGIRTEWPSSTYYAVWEYDPEASCTRKVKDPETGKMQAVPQQGGWLLKIGMRPHIPAGWERKVAAPGSRRRKAESEVHDDD